MVPFHILQDVALIALALAFAPLVTFVAIVAQCISSHTTIGRAAKHDRQQALLSKDHTTRTVLVTGVGMSKGLSIARAFYRQGHTVIAADFEPYMIPVCGRFSNAICRFYRLQKPAGEQESGTRYVEGIIEIVTREKADIWISCSGVSSAVDDALAAETVERQTSCKAIQFGVEITKTLHEKHTFIKQTEEFGLKVPKTLMIQSEDHAMRFFYDKWASMRPLDRVEPSVRREYILKPVGVEDSRRADMTILPFEDSVETIYHLNKLEPAAHRPYVIQKFIQGAEYCTHSLIVRGKVKAFTACQSAELLMHYRALSTNDPVLKEMLRFTQVYADKMGEKATGHFSVDFMVDNVSKDAKLRDRLYPIECNPRAHTAVVLFEDIGKEMVDAYLSVVGKDEASTRTNGHAVEAAIAIPEEGRGYYWVGHDLVTRVLLPILNVLRFKSGVKAMIVRWKEFADHVSNWKDGTFEVWDPWPFWALYVIYWPQMFLISIMTGSWWSRCNVSTTKMFRC